MKSPNIPTALLIIFSLIVLVLSRDRISIHRQHSLEDFNYNDYHTFQEILTWYEELKKTYAEDVLSISTVGWSVEGRPIKLVHIGDLKNTSRKSIFLNHGAHAREWISHATAIYLIKEMLNSFQSKSNESSGGILDFNWYILPVMNPDGYAYSWTPGLLQHRMWRKNRSRPKTWDKDCPSPGRPECCIGTDLNRNWNISWGSGVFSDNDTCSNSFHGVSPFSEKESSSLAKFLKRNNDHIEMFIAVHSYSQLWMWPYSYTNAEPRDVDYRKKLSLAAVAAIKDTHSKIYKTGPLHKLLYTAAGTSMDWVEERTNIPLSFAVELRPEDDGTATDGFNLSSTEIQPTFEEFFAALEAITLLLSSTTTSAVTCTSSAMCIIAQLIILLPFMLKD